MKYLIYIGTLLAFLGWGNSQNNVAITTRENIGIALKPDKELRKNHETSLVQASTKVVSGSCFQKPSDFLTLKNKEIQSTFFYKLDSTRKVQYPENDQEISMMVDLTPEYLNKFIADINLDTLLVNKRFGKEYHFNISPNGYSDPKRCKDKIEVIFDEKQCTFRLNIYNTFLVEPNWCTESMVVYGFSILNGKIVDFGRQEAG